MTKYIMALVESFFPQTLPTFDCNFDICKTKLALGSPLFGFAASNMSKKANDVTPDPNIEPGHDQYLSLESRPG